MYFLIEEEIKNYYPHYRTKSFKWVKHFDTDDGVVYFYCDLHGEVKHTKDLLDARHGRSLRTPVYATRATDGTVCVSKTKV